MRYADMMSPQTRTSRRLYEIVKLHQLTARQLAKTIGMGESYLSRILHGHRPVRVNDPRILKLGKLVGLKPKEIFELHSKNGAA